jgi:D-hydroxyproline dehydrogenase subunit gamma
MTGPVTIVVDGRPVAVDPTHTVAAALLAARGPQLRTTARDGEPRGMFCGMGICFDCLVTIDGRAGVRACMTRVRAGMRVDLA